MNFLKLLLLLLAGVPQSCAPLAAAYQTPSASYLDILGELNGFAQGTTGGKDGPVVVVTNLANGGSGSLREAVSRPGTAWIVFEQGLEGKVKLTSALKVKSDKTIDGRGADITLSGDALEIKADNVIVTGLKFTDSSNDAVRIAGNSRRVWIHRNSLSSADDGLIDVIGGSKEITVSWNVFSSHDKTLLLGHDKAVDEALTLSLHHNVFRETGERNPKLNRGKVHSYNNYITDWRWVGAYAEAGGEIYSEANIYEAGEDKHASNYKEENPGFLKSVNDRLENGARHEVMQPERVFDPSEFYTYQADKADSRLKSKLKSQAGWQPVPRPLDLSQALGETGNG